MAVTGPPPVALDPGEVLVVPANKQVLIHRPIAAAAGASVSVQANGFLVSV